MITLGPGEEVALEVRRHWIVLVLPGLFIGVLLFLPIFAYAVVSNLSVAWELPGNASALALYLYAGWGLFAWIVGVVRWVE